MFRRNEELEPHWYEAGSINIVAPAAGAADASGI
jgi:hypothetical protein